MQFVVFCLNIVTATLKHIQRIVNQNVKNLSVFLTIINEPYGKHDGDQRQSKTR